MAANKVEFGIEQLHVCTYEVDDNGDVTLGSPYHQVGAVGFAPEQSAEDNKFYADNVAYWSEYTDGPFEGDLEVAIFSDDFKVNFLGYKRTAGGGLANVKNATKPKVCIMFEYKGDKEARRAIFYNCALGAIKREYNTIAENKEPVTETIGVTCTGDNGTGITKVTLKPGDTDYDTLFTAPPVPELESES